MDISYFLTAAQAGAIEAGDMLKKNINSPREIEFKGAVNLVTNFDKYAQKLIFQYLYSRFPDHDFLAEEGLTKEKGSEYRWIIDPIDGTTNYAHKFPVFCVSIALERNQEVVMVVVYDPMRNEMFSATKGSGANLNGHKISVSSLDNLGKSLLATGFPYDIRESRENNLEHFSNFAVRAQAIRRCGSAAIDLCYVACGRFDGFWEMKLAPWDVAAGALLVTEAGGCVSDFIGGEFNLNGSEILASNNLIHKQMIDVLKLRKS